MQLRRRAPTIFATAFLSLLSAAENRRILENQLPAPIANGTLRSLGVYPDTARLNVVIGLPLRDKADLKAFIADLYDPASPNYKHYLTPDQFTARFGASAADYRKVVDFAKASGLTVTATASNRMIVDVAGSVSDFERVFRFTMRTYQHPSESRQFHAPDVAPSVPADVPILDIMGLDDYLPPRRVGTKPSPDQLHANITGSGPGGGFLAKDLRTAYAPGVTLTGAGQTIALFEFGPYSSADIAAYEQANNLPDVSVQNVLLDGVNGVWTPGYGDGEEALDIEMAMAMAPGAQILVYEGTSGGDIMNRMATDNSARQLSCSWGFLPAAATQEQILMEYAAQGQSFLHSSGDGGTWTTPINAPGGDPYTTEVGGTDLVTNGPGGAWLSESAWSGSGGGVDTSYPIPSWQTGVSMTVNQGSTVYRNFPDVAIVGAPTIYNFSGGRPGTGGGTSASAPLWAGFVALANQQAAANKKPPVGFLNPTVSALGQGARYSLDFHDITTGNNTNANSPNLYYAVPGYDLTSGWGAPNGQNLIDDLASGNSPTPGFSLSVAPFQISINQGSSSTTNVSVNPYGGFAGSVILSLSGLPTTVAAAFSPTSTQTNSTLTLTVPASVVAASYNGTITAISGSLKQSIAINLIVVAPTAPDFTLSASPSILSVTAGSRVQSAIAIAPAGAFANPVALSINGVPAGVTASFSPAGAASSSTLTLSAGSQVTPGIYILKLAGSSGSLNHASTIGLMVRASAQSPVPVDMSAAYNVTGIAADGTPFLTGMGDCCAYSANLLGTSLTVNQTVPFIFGPVTNGLTPPWNTVSESGGKVTVPLPAGQFASLQMLAAAKGGNGPAQQYQVAYSYGSPNTFTQSISDWNNPQNYPGETTAATMSYSDINSGGKTATAAYLYGYAFPLDVCRPVASFTLPGGNPQTLALTLVPSTTPCTAATVAAVTVVNGGNSISENTFIEIYGVNLAPSTVPPGGLNWGSAPEFAQGKMPTQLGGVSVTVDGQPAYIAYVSQGQINALTPLDSKIGTIPVVVTSGTSVSEVFDVDKVGLSPSFALAGGSTYLAATHGNGTYVGPTSLGASFTPAAPGEEIVLYGFGFGLPSGTPLVPGSSTQTGNLPFLPTIQIGGQAAKVVFAGLIIPGLYQFNVVIPPTAANGDNAVTAVYNKVAISTTGFVAVQSSN
jgi:uncharacterized protein (TIGR03437 family)